MSPWDFGWTQLLTLVGFAITIAIAMGGFRTFDRWKGEKLEERRIETAFEALALAYESKYVFDHIRNVMTTSGEYADMPRRPGESDDEWQRRGPYYATFKRIEHNKDFFERYLKLLPRCVALFGAEAEQIFLLVHKARVDIEIAGSTLASERNNLPREDVEQLRADLWDHHGYKRERDHVGQRLKDFRSRMEAMCRPIIDQTYGTKKPSERWLFLRRWHSTDKI